MILPHPNCSSATGSVQFDYVLIIIKMPYMMVCEECFCGNEEEKSRLVHFQVGSDLHTQQNNTAAEKLGCSDCKNSDRG